MKLQIQRLVAALEQAEVETQVTLRSVPEQFPQLESHLFLLLLDVQKVARQAKALQAMFESLPKAPQSPLPRRYLAQAKSQAQVQAEVQALVEAEAQVEVLEPQVQELVQASLPQEEWVGWVQVEEKE